jgi:uncharacterized membrane protein SirB2
MQYFTSVKLIHVSAVVVTATFFILRGVWMLRASPVLRHPVVRVGPHVNDTILFTSAMVLAAMLGEYPFVDGWLTAKVLGLLAYILLGEVALHWGRTRQIRAAAFAAALGVLGYIVSVARCHDALACFGN